MKSKRCKVLLIYHGAALEPSQRIFNALAMHKEIKLRVLGPRRGFNSMRNLVLEIPESKYDNYDLVTGQVYKAMKDFSGPYLTGLMREIIFFRPDIIHVFNEAYSLVNFQAILYRNIFLPFSKCLCLGVDNIISMKAATRKERFKRNFVHKNSDGVACWSKSARDALKEAGFPEKKLRIAYWGIPLDRFLPSRNVELRNQLGLSEKFVAGYVGRFQPEKGLWTLILALRHLPEIVNCICVGDGHWRETFLAKVKEFGLDNRVYWIPRVPDGDVPYYINAMDVLLLPSETMSNWKEQFGRVLVEAMACGVPCIGSDSGAISEILGEAGLIFSERDCSELAEAIKKLMADSGLYHSMRERGMARARKYFSCEAYAANLVSMYNEVLEIRSWDKKRMRCLKISG